MGLKLKENAKKKKNGKDERAFTIFYLLNMIAIDQKKINERKLITELKYLAKRKGRRL